jgi:hypothetical protein
MEEHSHTRNTHESNLSCVSDRKVLIDEQVVIYSALGIKNGDYGRDIFTVRTELPELPSVRGKKEKKRKEKGGKRKFIRLGNKASRKRTALEADVPFQIKIPENLH